MCENVSHSVMLNSLGSHGLQSTRILCPWNSPGKNTKGVAIPSSRGPSQPRDQTPASCMQAVSLPAGSPGKPFKCIRSESDFTNCSQRTYFHKGYSRVNQILVFPETKSDSFVTDRIVSLDCSDLGKTGVQQERRKEKLPSKFINKTNHPNCSISPDVCCCCSVAKSCLTPCDLQHTRLPGPSLSLGVCSNSCLSGQ